MEGDNSFAAKASYPKILLMMHLCLLKIQLYQIILMTRLAEKAARGSIQKQS